MVLLAPFDGRGHLRYTVPMGTALVRRDDAGPKKCASPRQVWRGLSRALRRAAVSTGRASAWLAKAGYHNRHYLPALVNGAVGDKLRDHDGALSIRMSFRREGRDVSPASLGQTLRSGHGHAVVFVHGLMADEVYWREPLGGYEGMGPALARDAGITPLYLRYNSGLHISENGRQLARILEELIEAHGRDIEMLTLVGHSMGGLVVRSAGHYGALEQHSWQSHLKSVVLLGTPNDGSYVEQAAHLVTRILGALTVHTRVIARVADERSAGIKDLRLGILIDEDWQGINAHRLQRHERTQVSLLPRVDYHVVAGTLSAERSSLLATWFGDGLIGCRSAHGSHVQVRVFTQTGHLGLISRPEVHAHVAQAIGGRRWLLSHSGSQ